MARNRLYGVGEPITMRRLHEGLDVIKALELIDWVGFTALREWMHIPVILSDPTTFKPEAVEAFTRTLDRCSEMDIEVTGMSHAWFLPPELGPADNSSMPPRDTTPGSVHMRTLEMLETSWRTLVGLFPQVTQWEVGNEWNIVYFLHPIGWKYGQPGFSLDEAMDIATDMMFYSARGIRDGSPNAKVASFSFTIGMGDSGLPWYIPADFTIAHALEKVYERIESGAFPSTNTDDYFDILAWHPYLISEMGYLEAAEQEAPANAYMPPERPDALWRAYSDAAYRVMARHGDAAKPVLLTEFGFSDAGLPGKEELHAQLWHETFETLKSMPYIKTIHTFRLFEQEKGHAFPTGAMLKANPEAYFGFFREAQHNYEPRLKAYALQKVCGGTKPLKRGPLGGDKPPSHP